MKLQKNFKRQATMVISQKFMFKPKGFRNTKTPSRSHLYLIRYQTIPNIKQKSRTRLPQRAPTASQPWRRNTVCLTPNWILCLLLYAAVRFVKLHCFLCFLFTVNLRKGFKAAKLTFQGSKLFFKVQQLGDKNFALRCGLKQRLFCLQTAWCKLSWADH